MKKPIILLMAVLLVAVFLSSCGCPANLQDPVPPAVEKSVFPAPEQSVPAYKSTPGLSSDDPITGNALAEETDGNCI